MGFRDDLEATQRRVDALERELADARRELAGASASDNDALRKQVGALTRERDALRAGVSASVEARLRRAAGLAAVLLVACLTAGALAYSSWQATHDAESALTACERWRETCGEDLAAAEQDRDEARRSLSELEDERSMERARDATRPGRSGTFIRFRIDRIEGGGRLAVGDECVLLVGYDSTEPGTGRVCHASLMCGDAPTALPGGEMQCAMRPMVERVPGSSPLSTVHGLGLDYVRSTQEVSMRLAVVRSAGALGALPGVAGAVVGPEAATGAHVVPGMANVHGAVLYAAATYFP